MSQDVNPEMVRELLERTGKILERNALPPAPPCPVCGETMSMAALGGGEIVFACSPFEDDPEHEGRNRLKPTRKFAYASLWSRDPEEMAEARHYADSRRSFRLGSGDAQEMAEGVQSLAAAYLALHARAEALTQERDAYREVVTGWANLVTNYAGAITPEMLEQHGKATDAVTALYGCDGCAGQTFEDGIVCCWTCGRELPSEDSEPRAAPTTTPGALPETPTFTASLAQPGADAGEGS